MAVSKPNAVAARFQKFLRDTELDLIHGSILDAVAEEIKDILGSSTRNPWNLDDLKYDENSWQTTNHGVYLVITEDPDAGFPAALYVGSAHGITSSHFVRISHHLKANHRLRHPDMLLYSYMDGKIDVPRNTFVVALARFPHEMFEDSAVRTLWIELTETIFMAVVGTIVSPGSVERDGRHGRNSRDTMKTPGVRWAIDKKRELWHSSQVENNGRYCIKTSPLTLSFDSGQVRQYGITAGDMVSTLLEIQPCMAQHAHAWADVEGLPDEYKERADSMGIRLSGTAKKQHGAVDIQDNLVIWLKHDSPVWEPTVRAHGYNRVNTAIMIIEWMLGEISVPRPPNRLNITSVRALDDAQTKKIMVSMAGWTEDEKRERRKAMAREGARRRTAARKSTEQGEGEVDQPRTAIEQEGGAEQSREQKEEVERTERFKFKAGRKRDSEKG